MTNADQAAAIAQIRNTFATRITELTAAIEADQGGYVFCWDNYGLGVLIQNGKPVTVGVEHATITAPTDRRIFRNGNDEPAILMLRKDAMKIALVSTHKSLAHMEEQLAKSS